MRRFGGGRRLSTDRAARGSCLSGRSDGVSEAASPRSLPEIATVGRNLCFVNDLTAPRETNIIMRESTT